MTSPLIEALADRLDLSPEEAAEALHDFSNDVRRRVSRSGEAVVPGLGVFRRHVGALVFEPDDRLSLAVNHRFAGLSELTVDAGEPAHNYRKTEFVASPDEEEPAEPEPPSGDAAGLPTPSLPDAEDEPRSRPEPEIEATPESVTPPESVTAEAAAPDAAEADPTEEPGQTAADDLEAEAPVQELPDEPDFYDAGDLDEPESRPFEEPEPVEPADAPAAYVSLDDLSEEPEEQEEPAEPEEQEPAFWEMEPDAPQPLGPAPDTYEEADFDLVGYDQEPPRDPYAPSAERTEDEVNERAPFFPPVIPPAETPDDDERALAERTPPGPAEAHAPAARAPEDDRRSRLPLLLAAVVVIIAVAAVFLLLPDAGTPPIAPPIAEGPPIAAMDSLENAAEDSSLAAVTPGGEPEPAEDAPAVTEPTPDASPDATPASPLRGGGAIDVSAGGYALVVSSWTEPGTAESEAERLRGQGFRAGVLSESSGGVTRYRVAVGQYPTLDAADAARTTESDVLPEGAWVLRIR